MAPQVDTAAQERKGGAGKGASAAGLSAGSDHAAAAPARLEGVPPLPPCRVRLVWERDGAARAAVAAAEDARPSSGQLAVRDGAGVYSAEDPFWAPVREAAVLTAADSDRRVRTCALPLRSPDGLLPRAPLAGLPSCHCAAHCTRLHNALEVVLPAMCAVT